MSLRQKHRFKKKKITWTYLSSNQSVHCCLHLHGGDQDGCTSRKGEPVAHLRPVEREQLGLLKVLPMALCT